MRYDDDLDLTADDAEDYRQQAMEARLEREARARRDRQESFAARGLADPVDPECDDDDEEDEDSRAAEAAVDEEQEYRHGIGSRAEDDEDAAERRSARDDD